MLKKLSQVRNWADFEALASSVGTKERGDFFEVLTKYYLLLDPTYKTELANVWLLSEVPQKVRLALNLPDRDQGIDIIAETKTGKYWAIQCKYRGSDAHSLTWREISTFTGLTFGVCTGIEYGLIAYTGGKYAKLLDSAAHLGFLSNDTWSALGEDFFTEVVATLKGTPKKLVVYSPRPHQKRAVENARKYFIDEKSTRGKLIMPCGAGKSLTGFWLAEELGAKTIVVAVPSLGLIQQTLPVWLREYAARGKHDDLRWLCVCSDQTVTKQDTDSIEIHTQDLGYPCLTDKSEIVAWFNETKGATPRVIFTTYQSGKVLAEAVREAGVEIDLGIMDEAHKTVGQKDKLFSHLLFDKNIPIKRRVFMTATERRYAGQSEEIISMDDPSVYGDTFDLLTFKDALEQRPPILSDYKIITMVIAQEEVAKLVAENKYVRPNGTSDEVEAQMLASMVALRKAMQKYPIKHAVSFHSSIARAREFRNFNATFTELNATFGELDTFHVTGATPSSERKKTIAEFAKADRALITNARCLTEGIDVPNIDCVLFTDPKHSTIDIVQAVGRALRPSKGKEYGYVLVPVISRGEDVADFVESAAFSPVLTVLRALAGNDERIIEHFRAIHAGKRLKGGVVEIDIDVKVGVALDLEIFAEKIETRVWSRLAQLSWRPYAEAADFVHALGLKSGAEWGAYCRGKYTQLSAKPHDIPANPAIVYRDEFREKGGMGAWLGTGYIANQLREYKEYTEALKFVHSLGLKSGIQWNKYCNGEIKGLREKPDDIPRNPTIYPDFKSMGEWLGTGRIANQNRKYQTYDDAVKFVHALKLKNFEEWRAYCRGKIPGLPKLPLDIPTTPHKAYKEVFQKRGGTGGWLGTGRVANQFKIFVPYDEAVKFVRTLGLTTQSEWPGYCNGKRPDLAKKPENIPNSPLTVYGEEFNRKGGWGGWLGTGNRKGGWRTYDEAVKFVHKLGLKNHSQWRDYCRGDRKDLPPKPWDIPGDPLHFYKEEFRTKGGWGAWVGTGNRKGGWRTYEEAIKFVHTLRLTSEPEWRRYTRGERGDLPPLPGDIPRAPYGRYSDFTKKGGWSAWLGTRNEYAKNDLTK